MADATIFAKTLEACLEAKKSVSSKKAVKESKKKSLTEKKFSKRFIKESDEDEDEKEDLEMETADDIVAVVDPDLDADEMTAVALGYQQLIDDAPENTIPETDKYVGDGIFGCPICGQTFFSEVPMGEGDVCPLCNAESPDGFVKAGEVEEGDASEVDKDNEEADVDEEEGDFDFDGEEISVDVDEDLEESKKVSKENKARRPVTRTVRSERRSARRVRGERIVPRGTSRRAVRGENRVARRASVRSAVRGESARPSLRRATATRRSVRGESLRRPSIRRAVRPSIRTEAKKPMLRRPSMRPARKVEGLNLDEKTFNVYLTKFIRENYNTATAFEVVSAKKNGSNLRLECVISMKSGKKNRAVLNCNYSKGRSIMTARDNGTFKVESKRAPFMFKVSTVGNVIRCEGMKYNFITKRGTKNEAKRYQVYGSYLKEGVKATRPARRVSEARRTSLRRPSLKRMNESRRPMRRTARRIAR